MQKRLSTTRKVDITDEMKRKVIIFVRRHAYITNRQCCPFLDLGYDQVITLFRHVVNRGDLIREEKTANTKYILPKR